MCITMVTAMSVVSMPVTFPACKKFRQVFAMVHTVDGNWRKVSEKLCKVYGMVNEIFMKYVNVVESFDEGLTKIAQGL